MKKPVHIFLYFLGGPCALKSLSGFKAQSFRGGKAARANRIRPFIFFLYFRQHSQPTGIFFRFFRRPVRV